MSVLKRDSSSSVAPVTAKAGKKHRNATTPLSREELTKLFVDSVNLFDAEEAKRALDQAWKTENNADCVLEILASAIVTCTKDLVRGVNVDWFIDVVRMFLCEVRIDIDAICFMDNLCILHVCVWQESAAWVHFLVREKNANVNRLSVLPPTIISPLSVAIMNLQRSINDTLLLPVIEILLANGADVEQTFMIEHEKWDSLKLAVESRNFTTVQALGTHMKRNWIHRYRDMISISHRHAYRLIHNDRDSGYDKDHQLVEMVAFLMQLLTAQRQQKFCFKTCPIVGERDVGLMVRCDTRMCPFGKWFHFGCAFGDGNTQPVNISRREVDAIHNWFCPDCNKINKAQGSRTGNQHVMTTRRNSMIDRKIKK